MEQPKKLPLYGILTIFNSILLLVLAYFFFTSTQSQETVFAVMNEAGKAQVELIASQEGGTLILRDAQGVDRIHIQGGETAAIMLKNSKGELVGTLFTGHDDAGAIGLGDADGNVAALMKGGMDPSLGFFKGAAYPALSFGISESIPHILFFSPTREQLVLHGGLTNSLLFIDEKGGVSLALTKEGLKQNADTVAQQFVVPYKIKMDQKLISNID